METQTPQSHFSFSRFSDLIRDSTKRGKTSSHSSHPSQSQSNHSHSKSIPFLESLDNISNANNNANTANATTNTNTNTSLEALRDLELRDRRRSSVANYTDRVRQMFTASPHPTTLHPRKTHITDLPPEILTEILHYLPFYDLLRCQLISPLFRSLVPGSSPLLAEALYLKPSRSLQIYSCIPATFDFDFDVTPRSIESGEQPEGTRFSVGVRKEFSMTRRCTGLIRMSEEIVFHPVIMDFNQFMMHGGRFLEHDAEGKGKGKEGEEGKFSWQDMLLSMPPLREVRMRHAKKKTVYRVLRVSEEEGEGVTLGHLFGVLREWAAE